MNITASPHSGAHAVKQIPSVKHAVPDSAAHKPHTLGNTPAVGSLHAKDHLQLSDHVQAEHHPLITPLKILTVHGGVMAVEQGAHFMLGKVSSPDHKLGTRSGSGPMKTVGAVMGAAASGYLAYTAAEHAQHAAKSGHSKAAAAYAVSAVLDTGLAVANTLAVFKKGPSVTVGVSLGVGALSTAASMWAAKLEQQAVASE